MTNNYEATVLFKRNYASTAHIVINQGGTSSGKTYAIEQVLFCLDDLNYSESVDMEFHLIPGKEKSILISDKIMLCFLSSL